MGGGGEGRVSYHVQKESMEKRGARNVRSTSSGGWMAGSPQYNRRENWGSMKVGSMNP